jgi:thymidylate synthase
MEINARTIADAWGEVLRAVLVHGSQQDVVADNENRNTIEYPGILLVNIAMPFRCMIPAGSKFDKHALENYAAQLWSGENPTGFAYTYGERLRNYEGLDQLRVVMDQLKKDPTSRREVAITWNPFSDCTDFVVPCMILTDWKLRHGQLNLTVYFRSHDMFGAWPSNCYGLAKLMERMASEIGAEVGRLSIVSSAAHIYEHDVNAAKMVAGCSA